MSDAVTIEEIKKAGIKNIEILKEGLRFFGNNGDTFILKQDIYEFWRAIKKLKAFASKSEGKKFRAKKNKENISGKEAAKRLECTSKIFSILISDHDLPTERKWGKGFIFDPKKIEAYGEKNRVLIKSLMSFHKENFCDDKPKEKRTDTFKRIKGNSLTGKEASKRIGCSLIGLYLLVRNHGLPVKSRWGKAIYIDPDVLEDFKEKNAEMIKSLYGSGKKLESEKSQALPIEPKKDETANESFSTAENKVIYIKSNHFSSIKSNPNELVAIDGGCTKSDFMQATGLNAENIETFIALKKLKLLNNGIVDESGEALIDIVSAKNVALEEKKVEIIFKDRRGFSKAFDRIAERRKIHQTHKEEMQQE